MRESGARAGDGVSAAAGGAGETGDGGTGRTDGTMTLRGWGAWGWVLPGSVSPDIDCLSDPGACGCPEQKEGSGGWVSTALSSAGRPRHTSSLFRDLLAASPVTWAFFNN